MMQGGVDDIETAMTVYLRGKQLQDPQAKVCSVSLFRLLISYIRLVPCAYPYSLLVPTYLLFPRLTDSHLLSYTASLCHSPLDSPTCSSLPVCNLLLLPPSLIQRHSFSLQYQLFQQAENLLLNTSLFPGPTQEGRNKNYVTTMNKICGSMLKLRNVYPTLDTSQRRRTPHEHLKLVKYITKTNMGKRAKLSCPHDKRAQSSLPSQAWYG
jgi:hypothetical protein